MELSYLRRFSNDAYKLVVCFIVVLLMLACSTERVEEIKILSVSDMTARAIEGCALANDVEVDAFLVVMGQRFPMIPSPDGETANIQLDLVRGQSVSIEIVLRESGSVIATASTTVPATGNTLDFSQDQFNLDCESSGAPVDIEDQDLDNDGIINEEDPDADGDGIVDFPDDTFVDLDGDGLDDLTGLTEAESGLSGESGESGESEPVPGAPVGGDTDGDGFIDVTDQAPCGSEPGGDNNSSNDTWNDNCAVRRFGQFSDSGFTVGIQRVVFCAGFGTASSYTDFADGELGQGTEAAIQEFQRTEPNPLVDDGVVGANTWAKLQDSLVLLQAGSIPTDGSDIRDSYGFTEGRCAGIALFYQNRNILDGITVVGPGWSLARNTPNENQSLPFDIVLRASDL